MCVPLPYPLPPPGYFYHKSEWIDLNGDGKLDLLTARGTKPIIGTAGGELLWLEQPASDPLTNGASTQFDPACVVSVLLLLLCFFFFSSACAPRCSALPWTPQCGVPAILFRSVSSSHISPPGCGC
jgi:hypothetical protein